MWHHVAGVGTGLGVIILGMWEIYEFGLMKFPLVSYNSVIAYNLFVIPSYNNSFAVPKTGHGHELWTTSYNINNISCELLCLWETFERPSKLFLNELHIENSECGSSLFYVTNHKQEDIKTRYDISLLMILNWCTNLCMVF